MPLPIRAKASCRFDLVALGEVMLRLDPGDKRIATTRRFRVWEGGGEYNVARGLKRCFGLDTAIVTALADNPVGRLVQDLMYQGGVDQSHVRWVAYDGVGRTARNGLNFTERGFGVRAAVGCSDRGHTAVSQLAPGMIDWDRLFGGLGARAGSTPAGSSPRCRSRPPRSPRRRWRRPAGTAPSCRTTSTTASRCGRRSAARQRAQEVNRGAGPPVDVLIGNEEDFTAALGFAVDGVGDGLPGSTPRRSGR